MSKKIEEINSFANRCGYFYNACFEEGITVNNGYNCKHPEQGETEAVDGKTIGKCYCWSCPLGCEAEEEDFENKELNPEGYEYEESQFIIVDKE